jgi:hypothetical protein
MSSLEMDSGCCCITKRTKRVNGKQGAAAIVTRLF